MIITILAYKSDTIDTCMGCVMARFSSDFKWKSSMSRNDMIQFLADLLFADKRKKYGEDSYEITFLINGEEPTDWELEQVKTDIEVAAQNLATLMEIEFQNKKTAEEQKKQVAKQTALEQNERQQLAILQAKYKV